MPPHFPIGSRLVLNFPLRSPSPKQSFPSRPPSPKQSFLDEHIYLTAKHIPHSCSEFCSRHWDTAHKTMRQGGKNIKFSGVGPRGSTAMIYSRDIKSTGKELTHSLLCFGSRDIPGRDELNDGSPLI